jgi:hypothetical protein
MEDEELVGGQKYALSRLAAFALDERYGIGHDNSIREWDESSDRNRVCYGTPYH